MPSFIHNIERFIKDWTLLIAIVLGTVFHSFFGFIAAEFEYLLPTLIFVMLFLSFSKIEGFGGKKILWYIVLMAIQIAVGAALYFAIRPYDETLAIGIALCVLVSPATSSPVVVNLMHGNIAFSTEFLLFDSVVAAFLLPFAITFVSGNANVDFGNTVLDISGHTLVVVLVPLCLALLLRKFSPKFNTTIKKVSFMSYYLWAFSLMIIMGECIDTFLAAPEPDYKFAIQSLLLTTVVCFVLIMGGKLLGGDKSSGIAAGQALGQKNTILAIWLAGTFLGPEAAILPTTWIISQNIINSVQLWNANRK